ncbi:SDR family NAD(P)-dependent oxidoreductase [Methylovirgula sp. 4M-Z18]|uniref:SDR family NAD(P)-dependent oxidoreductase n=1 Tax=Methylovirgula sp. 4M-Z18 TaxID=2293567 RepID=UPI001FE05DAF|nr:SDR family NAD(P)-dependent oxidoreductase [Methylovirgula sp. 4M-Z18]
MTGASSGIGYVVALELARRGYRVAASARRADALQDLVATAAGMAGTVRAYPLDVLDAAATAAAIPQIRADLGPIVLAFLNAGSNVPDKGLGFGGEGSRRTFDLNLTGTLNCLQPLLPAMTEQGKGQIIINASIAGYGPLPTAIAYGASKAALIHVAAGLRLKHARDNLLFQVLNPGFIRTPLTAKNKFPMPFLMEADVAARRICDGFQRSGFEITFPRRLAWPLKALNLLPWPAYLWLLGKANLKD